MALLCGAGARRIGETAPVSPAAPGGRAIVNLRDGPAMLLARRAVAAGRCVQYALSPVRRLAHPAEVDVSYFRQQQNRG